MKPIVLTLAMLFSLNAISQISLNHLEIGDKAPSINGIDQFGKSIKSSKILKEKQVLLVFYRGGWCKYCKKHLTELQTNLEAFTKKGFYVIVVTPESVEKTKETTKNLNVDFSIISDVNNQIMRDYKVLFEVNEQNITSYYELIKKKVMEYNVDNNLVLPVTATYIITKKGKIGFVQYNPDYSKRSDFNEMLKTL